MRRSFQNIDTVHTYLLEEKIIYRILATDHRSALNGSGARWIQFVSAVYTEGDSILYHLMNTIVESRQNIL